MRWVGAMLVAAACGTPQGGADLVLESEGICRYEPLTWTDGQLATRVRPTGTQVDDTELVAVVRTSDDRTHEVRSHDVSRTTAWSGPWSTYAQVTYAHRYGESEIRAYDADFEQRWAVDLPAPVVGVGNLESVGAAEVLMSTPHGRRYLAVLDGVEGTAQDLVELPPRIDLAIRCSYDELGVVIDDELYVLHTAVPSWML